MTEKLSVEPRFLSIEENYKEIVDRIGEAAIKSGRRPEDIRFMAVTKTVEPVFINHALSLGIDLIGENKVQELLGKTELLVPADVEKHLIGHLQTNKVRKIVDTVSMIQSVDSGTLLTEIQRQAEKHEKTIDILIELNVGGEEAKTGLPVESLGELLACLPDCPNVRLRGLMAVPPICEDPLETRRYFSHMRRLFEDLRAKPVPGAKIDTLSLGMSSDYVEAILEGSTLVRIGSALFGMRRY